MNLNILLSKLKTGMFEIISLPLFFGTWVIYFFDSIDEEVVEISDNEMEVEDDDELALIPSSSRTGMPSTPSPIKALLVLFYFTSIIIFYT